MNKPHLKYEKKIPGIVAGVDEAGRGPLVGPVFAAAVILDMDNIISSINDSKKLSPKKREDLYNKITSSYTYAVGSASVTEIDELNILGATKLAMQRAINALKIRPNHLLIDGNQTPPVDIPMTSIVQGDTISLSIAAASILAKVSRDQLMIEMHKEFPLYNWQKNKGYPTQEHILAIKKYGFNRYYRQTFSPIKNMLENN